MNKKWYLKIKNVLIEFNSLEELLKHVENNHKRKSFTAKNFKNKEN